MVFFCDSFKVVLFHFFVSEGEIVIDVEGSDKNFLDKVGFFIECSGFGGINELDFDDSIFAIDRVCFDVTLFFPVFQIHVDHLILKSFFHVLDNQLFAISYFVFNGFGFVGSLCVFCR